MHDNYPLQSPSPSCLSNHTAPLNAFNGLKPRSSQQLLLWLKGSRGNNHQNEQDTLSILEELHQKDRLNLSARVSYPLTSVRGTTRDNTPCGQYFGEDSVADVTLLELCVVKDWPCLFGAVLQAFEGHLRQLVDNGGVQIEALLWLILTKNNSSDRNVFLEPLQNTGILASAFSLLDEEAQTNVLQMSACDYPLFNWFCSQFNELGTDFVTNGFTREHLVECAFMHYDLSTFCHFVESKFVLVDSILSGHLILEMLSKMACRRYNKLKIFEKMMFLFLNMPSFSVDHQFLDITTDYTGTIAHHFLSMLYERSMILPAILAEFLILCPTVIEMEDCQGFTVLELILKLEPTQEELKEILPKFWIDTLRGDQTSTVNIKSSYVLKSLMGKRAFMSLYQSSVGKLMCIFEENQIRYWDDQEVLQMAWSCGTNIILSKTLKHWTSKPELAHKLVNSFSATKITIELLETYLTLIEFNPEVCLKFDEISTETLGELIRDCKMNGMPPLKVECLLASLISKSCHPSKTLLLNKWLQTWTISDSESNLERLRAEHKVALIFYTQFEVANNAAVKEKLQTCVAYVQRLSYLRQRNQGTSLVAKLPFSLFRETLSYF
mmetsp:Transcript_24577/g.27960  ORF Transcript_24577/g.27960 Transcript_24577/m.27960 type:complete len:608 (-) Transcript_24577:2739-4562(-)